MPELRRIAISELNEPENAARIAMDEEKMEALRSSIREVGQLYPLIVFPVDGGRYEIEDGHRRYLAMRDIHAPEANCLVYERADLAHEVVKFHANYHEEMSEAEEALFFADCMERGGMAYAELLERFKLSDGYASDRLKLLRGDPEVFRALSERKIKFGVARELNRIPDEQLRRYYLHYAETTGCTARTAKMWVEQAKLNSGQTAAAAPVETAAAEPVQGVVEQAHCFCCGGNRDPWNLVWVQMHNFCKESVERAMRPPEE